MAGAESYESISGASDYVRAWHGSDHAWFGYTCEQQERRLRVGSRRLDEVYGSYLPGRRANKETGALEWPRFDAYDRGGILISSSSVPIQVRHATVELAIDETLLTAMSSTSSSGSAKIKSERVKIDTLEVETEYVDGIEVASSAAALGRVTSILGGLISRSRRAQRA